MTYRFYIETVDGQQLEWRGLTITQAKCMKALTNKFCTNSNIASFGWEETK